jgi:hypothetical protein
MFTTDRYIVKDSASTRKHTRCALSDFKGNKLFRLFKVVSITEIMCDSQDTAVPLVNLRLLTAENRLFGAELPIGWFTDSEVSARVTQSSTLGWLVAQQKAISRFIDDRVGFDTDKPLIAFDKQPNFMAELRYDASWYRKIAGYTENGEFELYRYTAYRESKD